MPTTALARTRTALEVELTLKGRARIYLAYRQHLEAIADQAYERVHIALRDAAAKVTGITDPALLRASHIVPWKDCHDDAERLNVHNGLLLSALWDAALDRRLVTFDDDGRPVLSRELSARAKSELRWREPIPLTQRHRERLALHRGVFFQDSEK